MNEVYKLHELTINISPQTRTNIITNTTFFSMDIKTGKKVINFTLDNEALDLRDATVMLGFEFVDAGTSKIIDSKDGSVVVEDALSGRCSVVLPNHLYDYSGRVYVHVYIMFDDGRSFDCGVIVTDFEESWLDSELEEMSDFYVKRFEDLIREIRNRAEEIRSELGILLDEVTEEIGIEFDGIRAQITDTKQDITDFKVNSKEEITDFMNDSKSIIIDFKNETKSDMMDFGNNLQDELKGQLTDIKEQVKDSINVAEMEFAAVSGAIKEVMQERLDGFISQLEYATNGFESSKVEVVQVINDKMSIFDEGLEAVLDEFRNSKVSIEEMAARLEEKESQFQVELTQTLSTFEELRDKVSEMLEQMANGDIVMSEVHYAHVNDDVRHVTADDRERWDSMELAGTWDGLAGRPDRFEPIEHSHGWSQITGRPTIPTVPNTSRMIIGGPEGARSIAASAQQLTRANGTGVNIGTGSGDVAAGNHDHTAAQVGASPTSHNHSITALTGTLPIANTSGTLTAARGGTGHTTLQATRNAMGLGNTTGFLPIANGGTGATSAANARTALGAAATSHTHAGSQITGTISAAQLPAALGTRSSATFSGAVTINGILHAGQIRSQWADQNPVNSTRTVLLGLTGFALHRHSSARKYKMLIETPDTTEMEEKLLNLKFRSWWSATQTAAYADVLTKRHNGEDVNVDDHVFEPIKRWYGLIAEELEEAGLGTFVYHNADGEAEGIEYTTMWTLLIPIVRKHRDEISDLKARIERLEALINA